MANVQRTPFSQVRYAFAKCEPLAKNLAEWVHFGADSRFVRWGLTSSEPFLPFFSSFVYCFHSFDIPMLVHLFLLTLIRKGRWIPQHVYIKNSAISTHNLKHVYLISFDFLYTMSIAIFLSIYLPKTCDKWENSNEMCAHIWSLSLPKLEFMLVLKQFRNLYDLTICFP